MFKISNDDDDLFFTCYIIEMIGRVTKNTRKDIVNKIGMAGLLYLYKCADVLHQYAPEQVTQEMIEDYKITNGTFDNVAECDCTVPEVSGIARIYMMLTMNTFEHECTWHRCEENTKYKKELLEHLKSIYNSWISEMIDNYTLMFFIESPNYMYDCYMADDVL